MAAQIPRLERRYLFTGDLVLQTPLHIGGGDITLGMTDKPIIRAADERPFIPGSSLKGAFRSTVEKLTATLEPRLMKYDVLDTGSDWLQRFNTKRSDQEWDDERTVQEVQREWPITSHLFGTPYTASKIFFSDAYLRDDQEPLIQRRDGVAIDRDSERAMDRLKYDYEVVPPSMRFGFELWLENPCDLEISLTCLGLAELLHGFFSIGGKRSSGLGRCVVQGLQVYELDLIAPGLTATERFSRLQRYLKGKTSEEKFVRQSDTQAFIDQHIAKLPEQIAAIVKGDVHAQTPGQ